MISMGVISTALGGLTGLIGTVWSTHNKRKEKELEIQDRKNEREHERAMVRAESDAMIAESKAQIEVTSARVAGDIELSETAAFTESLKADRSPSFQESYMDRLFEVKGWLRILAIPCGTLLAVLFGLVDTIKSVARPGITAYLLGLSTWITFKAWEILEKAGAPVLTPQMAVGILSDTINIVLYLTVTAVTWWFGDRMASKGLAKNLKLGRV